MAETEEYLRDLGRRANVIEIMIELGYLIPAIVDGERGVMLNPNAPAKPVGEAVREYIERVSHTCPKTQ